MSSRPRDPESDAVPHLPAAFRPEYVAGRVSTVITSYNKGPWLAEAIDSALAQDHSDHEILVVDDGSTDDSPAVMARYAGRARCIRQGNLGQSAAKNRGIIESTGEFVAFLDGDDRWRPGKLRKQVELFGRSPAVGLVYTDRLIFTGDGEVVMRTNREWHVMRRGRVLDDLLASVFIPFSSAVVRRSVLARSGLFDEGLRVSVDYDLWLRVARLCEVDFVDEVLLEYRTGCDNVGARVGTKVPVCFEIQDRFIARFYRGRYPNRRAVNRANCRKHCSLGDYHLAAGRRGPALAAFGRALRCEPWNPIRYRSVVRALLPASVAAFSRACLAVGRD